MMGVSVREGDFYCNGAKEANGRTDPLCDTAVLIFITTRLGQQVRQRRLNRGLTQADLAALAGITRQKVIAIEKGDLSVGMLAYARILGALDCEFAVVPAAMPTLDEIQGVFD